MKQTAKILLVDDEPGMLRYIKTLLEVDDYKVETATTGEEAGCSPGAERSHARRLLREPGTNPAARRDRPHVAIPERVQRAWLAKRGWLPERVSPREGRERAVRTQSAHQLCERACGGSGGHSTQGHHQAAEPLRKRGRQKGRAHW